MKPKLLIGVCLLVTSAATLYAQPTSAPAPSATTSRPPPTTPATTYIHPGTKMPFPEKLVEFTRLEVTKFAPDESDVGIGYNFDERTLPITATVYVFPAPAVKKAAAETDDQLKQRQFQLALNAVKKEIAGVLQDAKVLGETAFTLKENGRSHPGAKVTYEMTARFGRPTTSDMFLFVDGPWQIEYRFSYRTTDKDLTPPYIAKLMEALKWGNMTNP